jgi:hypothetical protein
MTIAKDLSLIAAWLNPALIGLALLDHFRLPRGAHREGWF